MSRENLKEEKHTNSSVNSVIRIKNSQVEQLVKGLSRFYGKIKSYNVKDTQPALIKLSLYNINESTNIKFVAGDATRRLMLNMIIENNLNLDSEQSFTMELEKFIIAFEAMLTYKSDIVMTELPTGMAIGEINKKAFMNIPYSSIEMNELLKDERESFYLAMDIETSALLRMLKKGASIRGNVSDSIGSVTTFEVKKYNEHDNRIMVISCDDNASFFSYAGIEAYESNNIDDMTENYSAFIYEQLSAKRLEENSEYFRFSLNNSDSDIIKNIFEGSDVCKILVSNKRVNIACTNTRITISLPRASKLFPSTVDDIIVKTGKPDKEVCLDGSEFIKTLKVMDAANKINVNNDIRPLVMSKQGDIISITMENCGAKTAIKLKECDEHFSSRCCLDPIRLTSILNILDKSNLYIKMDETIEGESNKKPLILHNNIPNEACFIFPIKNNHE